MLNHVRRSSRANMLLWLGSRAYMLLWLGSRAYVIVTRFTGLYFMYDSVHGLICKCDSVQGPAVPMLNHVTGMHYYSLCARLSLRVCFSYDESCSTRFTVCNLALSLDCSLHLISYTVSCFIEYQFSGLHFTQMKRTF